MHAYLRTLDRFLACLVCGGNEFVQRELRMATGLLDTRGQAAADVAVCRRCGHLHPFLGEALQWLEPDQVKPGDLPVDPLA